MPAALNSAPAPQVVITSALVVKIFAHSVPASLGFLACSRRSVTHSFLLGREHCFVRERVTDSPSAKMRHQTGILAAITGFVAGCQACGSCFGPINKVEHVRHVKRMQPDAHNATYGPTRGPLEWGQLNFLHTVSFWLSAEGLDGQLRCRC